MSAVEYGPRDIRPSDLDVAAHRCNMAARDIADAAAAGREPSDAMVREYVTWSSREVEWDRHYRAQMDADLERCRRRAWEDTARRELAVSHGGRA